MVEESEHIYRICEHLSANDKIYKSINGSILNNKYGIK